MKSNPKIVIIDNDIDSIIHLKNSFSNMGFDVLSTPDFNNGLNSIFKKKPLIVLLDFNFIIENNLDILHEIAIKSPQTNIILTGKELPSDSSKTLLETGEIFCFIKKPFKFNFVRTRIEKILSRNKIIIESQKTLQDLFESYNQLEFITTILINDVENFTNLMQKLVDNVTSSELNETQYSAIKKISRLLKNNTKLLERFNNLRLIDEINPTNFTMIDLNKIIDEIIVDIRKENKDFTQNFCKISTNNIFIKGQNKEVKILLSEAIHLVASPETNICSNLKIIMRNSNKLVNEENKNLPTVEIELITTLEEKLDYEDELQFQQYGFGYFLLKGLVESFYGKLLLEDNKLDEITETKLTILLPSCK